MCWLILVVDWMGFVFPGFVDFARGWYNILFLGAWCELWVLDGVLGCIWCCFRVVDCPVYFGFGCILVLLIWMVARIFGCLCVLGSVVVVLVAVFWCAVWIDCGLGFRFSWFVGFVWVAMT